MMELAKKILRQNNDVVLLVCDFYETKQIPNEMTTQKENLALFPVANIPLIVYILSSLQDQNFQNIIVTGRNTAPIKENINNLSLFEDLKVVFMEVEANNLGDVFRVMNENDCDLKDLLVLYANHYTNYDLHWILKQHRLNNHLLTLFLHNSDSNSKVNHFYGTIKEEIVFYKKCINGKYNVNNIKDTLETHKTVQFHYNLSSPTIGVISSDVLFIFRENFDYSSLGDLLEGLFAFNPFNHKIGIVQGGVNWYSREVITLLDYFKFNEDVKSGRFINISNYPREVNGELKSINFCMGSYFYDIPDGYTNELFMGDPQEVEKIRDTVLGTKNKLMDDFMVVNSIVGDGCTISANINKCIVWDDIYVNQDLSGYIVFSPDNKISFDWLEIEIEVEEEIRAISTFFDDLVGYLKECVDLDLERLCIEEVVKQVNMLRIIWNASDWDLIEAFAVFLTDIVSEDDVEDSAICASFFFPVLEGSVNTPSKQEELLLHILNFLKDKNPDFKKKVFCIYAYQLFEDGIISRSIFKEYNMRVSKDLM